MDSKNPESCVDSAPCHFEPLKKAKNLKGLEFQSDSTMADSKTPESQADSTTTEILHWQNQLNQCSTQGVQSVSRPSRGA
ncbi:hypothetical protein T36_1798 [Helicobacter cinaedi]|uniref:hypothetical protein n=1 Tax=Helicobacter cinaedi TaxID=213 RepID=UPI001F38EED9|nr:hypothetical protein [Helicobacter cinaedi]BDB65322.1 hypothetical protein T36_1798 [Helicobacter cinaedi]